MDEAVHHHNDGHDPTHHDPHGATPNRLDGVWTNGVATAATARSSKIGTIAVQASAANGTVPIARSPTTTERLGVRSHDAVITAIPPTVPTAMTAGAAPAAISSSHVPSALTFAYHADGRFSRPVLIADAVFDRSEFMGTPIPTKSAGLIAAYILKVRL